MVAWNKKSTKKKMLLIATVLCACLALSSAFPWSLVGDSAQSQEALFAQVSSSSCMGIPSPVPGSPDNLHLCSLFGQGDVCFATSLTPCCANVAVIGQMARALTFDLFNDTQSGHSVRFYQVDQGACYFIEPAITPCFDCPMASCATVPNPYCEIGVNDASCADGRCECKRGFDGEFCCSCLAGFFRPLLQDGCEECGCCSENIVDESSICDQSGNCGICKPGFFGNTCCESCGCCTNGTVDGSNDCGSNGQCSCAPGFSGDKCCTNECNCCTDGTVGGSNACDASGQCTCIDEHTGTTCCEALQCAALTDPANGAVSVAGLSLGSTATYTCEDGYQLTGAASRQCEVQSASTAAGWSGDEPTCTSLLTCGERTDVYFILDTSLGITFQPLCVQTYTAMEIVAALKIGTDPQESLVEPIIYPAPTPNEPDVNATRIFELGDPSFTTCEEIIDELELFQIDLLSGVFVSGHTRVFQTRGASTLPHRAIKLLGSDLPGASTPSRRRIGILFTAGVQNTLPGLSLEEARATLPEGFELIAAGYNETTSDSDELQEQLQIIAGSADNVVLGTNIVEVARSVVQKLQEKNVICDPEAEAILERIDDNGFDKAMEYCRCLSNEINPIRENCPSRPPTPSCSSRIASLMDFNEFFEFANEEESLPDDIKSEIMAAVQRVLDHSG